MNYYDEMMRREMDGRRGVKGTGRYGIGGSHYYGRDRSANDYGMGNYTFSGMGEYDNAMYDEDNARRYGRRDYADMDYPMYEDDYARRYGRRDMSMYPPHMMVRDYGHKLSRRDFENWKRELVNDDGSRGEHFSIEQIMPIAKQLGINVEEIGEDVLCMTVNMLYSDYCKFAKEINMDRLDFYVRMAKAWLKDKDFYGSPAEKLAQYYKHVVMYEGNE